MLKFTVVVSVAFTAWYIYSAVMGYDAAHVNFDEAVAFLTPQTDFETYTVGDDVLCKHGKTSDTWGRIFHATRADGSTFDGIVCADPIHYVMGENSADDPLNLIDDRDFHLIPIEGYYRVDLLKEE